MTIIHQQVAAILVFTKYLYICNYYIYIPIVINDYPWLSSIIYPLLSTVIQLLYIHYYPLLSDYYALLSIIVHYYPLHPWLSILIHYQALFNVSNGKMIPTNQSVSRGDELYDHHPVDEPPEIGHPLGMTRTTRGCVLCDDHHPTLERPWNSGGPSGGTWVALVPCCWASISLSHSGAVFFPTAGKRNAGQIRGRLQFFSNGA